MKVRDFINLDISIDVVDDICEALYIGFEGPQNITNEAKNTFADVLDLDIEILDSLTALVHLDNFNEHEGKRKLHDAIIFFEAAAGYCAESKYQKWFI